jgi:uncharacterized protein YqgV (UPF0045/DUF77 family)
MAKKSKKWNEKLFELLIIFGMSCVAYFILKNSELGSVTFFAFLAFGFAYLYHNVENLKYDLSAMSENVETNFNQTFESLQRKNEAIEASDSQLYELKLIIENLENQIADLKYEIQSKQ